MADRLTPEQRHRAMAAVRSKETSIEVMLRKELWRRGLRGYRKNYKKLPGKPDIVYTKQKVAIFCDSEFWHGYDWENGKKDFKSRQEYWIPKIERNINRDKEVNEQLSSLGWVVLRFWGNQIKKDVSGVAETIGIALGEIKRI